MFAIRVDEGTAEEQADWKEQARKEGRKASLDPPLTMLGKEQVLMSMKRGWFSRTRVNCLTFPSQRYLQ